MLGHDLSPLLSSGARLFATGQLARLTVKQCLALGYLWNRSSAWVPSGRDGCDPDLEPSLVINNDLSLGSSTSGSRPILGAWYMVSQVLSLESADRILVGCSNIRLAMTSARFLSWGFGWVKLLWPQFLLAFGGIIEGKFTFFQGRQEVLLEFNATFLLVVWVGSSVVSSMFYLLVPFL